MFNERVSDTRSYLSNNPQEVPVTPPSPEELLRLLFEAIPRLKGRTHASVEGKIRWTLHVLFEEKAVVEVRAFRDRRVMSGYFNDHDVLAEAAAELDAQGWQVYVTLNPVDEALLDRSANQIVEYPRVTTSDIDIARRHQSYRLQGLQGTSHLRRIDLPQ